MKLRHLLVFGLALAGCAVLANPLVLLSGRPPAGGSFVLEEGFEGTGVPTSWGNFGEGTPTFDFDYTTSPAPLRGAKSLFIPDNTSGSAAWYFDFGAVDEIYVAMEVHVVSRSSGVTDPHWRLLADSTTDTVAGYDWRSVAAGSALNVGAEGGFTESGATSVSMTAGNTYRLMFYFAKGTGSNAVASVWITTGTSSWGTPNTRTNGTSTAQVRYFMFRQPAANYDYEVIVDYVVADTSEIPISYFE